MRFLARIAKTATLSLVPSDDTLRVTLDRHFLDLDGHRAIVSFEPNTVRLLRGDGRWESFPLPKNTRGQQQARLLYTEIVECDRLEAERRDRQVAALDAEIQRRDADKAHRAALAQACAELQERFHAIVAARQLDAHCGVRFYVADASRVGASPSYPPTRAAVIADLHVTPEEGGRLLDLLLQGGFLRR